MGTRKLLAILVLAYSAAGARATSANDALLGMVSGSVDRFEVTGEARCTDGSIPNLKGLVQYSLPAGSANWRSGWAKNYAPYLWLSQSEKVAHVWFSSLVKGEWIFCDDDGDEFTRRKDYWFQSRYAVTGEVGNAVLTQQGFVPMRGQSVPNADPLAKLHDRRHLVDANFFYADPVVDGPSEHWTYLAAQSLELELAPVDVDTLIVSLPGACPVGQPYKATYKRSLCESPYHCDELPLGLVRKNDE